jgi:hypothetical protein
MLTHNVAALPLDMQRVILETVKTFDDFGIDNDPYHEHDFGAFELYETRFFFKIDTYEKGTDYTVGAEHPENATTTDRVLTIMFADDY